MLCQLRKPSKRVVGLKQTVKVAASGEAQHIFLARDADPPLKKEIEDLCREYSLPLTMVETRVHLGEACGIDVGSATAALLKKE